MSDENPKFLRERIAHNATMLIQSRPPAEGDAEYWRIRGAISGTLAEHVPELRSWPEEDDEPVRAKIDEEARCGLGVIATMLALFLIAAALIVGALVRTSGAAQGSVPSVQPPSNRS